MAAVVGPVGVDDLQLSQAGIPLLLVSEIVPAKGEIRRRHGKPHGLPVRGDFLLRHGGEAGYPRHVGGHVGGDIQGLGLVQGGDAGLHRVDEIGLHPSEFLVGQRPLQAYHPGGKHPGPLPLGEQLDALGGGIRPLVVLAGEVFHGEHPPSLGHGEFLVVHIVGVGLGEDDAPRPDEFLRRKAFDVIADQQPQAGQLGQPQIIPQICQHMPGLDVEALPLFHKYPDHIRHSLTPHFIRYNAGAPPCPCILFILP